MWLDAFKPKFQNMQKIGVTGVTGVTPRENSINTRTYINSPSVTPENVTGVTGVTGRVICQCVTPVTPCDTGIESMCHRVKTSKKPNEYNDLDKSVTPVTPVTPQKHYNLRDNQELIEVLKLFEFDRISQANIDDEYMRQIDRVNNMAWEFMVWDGMEFMDAIKAASEIVTGCPVAVCESAYVDAKNLFKRLTPKGLKPPE
jgi:hypothetical protein